MSFVASGKNHNTFNINEVAKVSINRHTTRYLERERELGERAVLLLLLPAILFLFCCSPSAARTSLALPDPHNAMSHGH